MEHEQLIPECFTTNYQKTKTLLRMADTNEKHLEEIRSIRSELEKTRNEFADFKTKYAEQRKADAVQAEVNENKQRRHEYFVSAFTVALTLFIEHFFDLVKIANVSIKLLVALFE